MLERFSSTDKKSLSPLLSCNRQNKYHCSWVFDFEFFPSGCHCFINWVFTKLKLTFECSCNQIKMWGSVVVVNWANLFPSLCCFNKCSNVICIIQNVHEEDLWKFTNSMQLPCQFPGMNEVFWIHFWNLCCFILSQWAFNSTRLPIGLSFSWL